MPDQNDPGIVSSTGLSPLSKSETPRVLVEAYECSPVSSHAPGSTWEIITRLARWFELWVVTEATQYRSDIEACLSVHKDVAERLHFYFLPRAMKMLPKRKRPVLPIRETIEYRMWLKRSYKLARELHGRYGFSLVHHLRGNTFREPGYLWKLDLPFVWGPTGGTNAVPWHMLGELDARARLQHLVRALLTSLQLRFSSRVRSALRTSHVLIAQTSHDQRMFRSIHGKDTVLIHEQGCSPEKYHQRYYDGKRPLNLAWIGRFVASKGLPFLLDALATLPERDRVRLHIAGAGPYEESWKKHASMLGIAALCIWHGWLPQDSTLSLLDRCDLLVLTSLLEATCTTVMDAISLGVPVICMNLCGFGDVVSSGPGIVISAKGAAEAKLGYAMAISSILRSPKIVETLSRKAYTTCKQSSWDAIASGVREAYETALQKQPAPAYA